MARIQKKSPELTEQEQIWRLKLQITSLQSEVEDLRTQISMLQRGGDKPFYTIGEISQLWGLSYETVRRKVRMGEIPAVKVGAGWRITRETLLRGIQ